jgi:hypothetical protein
MYRTIQSPASVKADATVGEETGLRLTAVDPVLACPVALFAAAPFAGLVGKAVWQGVQADHANQMAADNSNVDAGTSPDFTAAVTYVPPGRLSVNSAPVSSSASVDELISAVRRDHTSA